MGIFGHLYIISNSNSFKTPASLHGALDGLDALDESLLDNEGIYAAKYNDGMK
jgi:hypothetical protein